MGLTSAPSSGLGYEGQDLQTYLAANYSYSTFTPGITINITIPANYVLGGYSPSQLHALNLSGFSPLDTINIYNYGKIIGGAGTGGSGRSGNAAGNPSGAGTSGIFALLCGAPVNLYNYGDIRGGGSGGGGGGGGNYGSGKGYTTSTGGTGGSGFGLNINSASGANQAYTIIGNALNIGQNGAAGGTRAGSGGTGGVWESVGTNGGGGTFTIVGGKSDTTVGTTGGTASTTLSYAINGISKITVVENTGTIGATTG
jgi:hypothetical protein